MEDQTVIDAFPGVEDFEFLLRTQVGVIDKVVWRESGPFGFITSEARHFFNLKDVYRWEEGYRGTPRLRRLRLTERELIPGLSVTFDSIAAARGPKATLVVLWEPGEWARIWREWRLVARDAREDKLVPQAELTTLWQGRDLRDLRKQYPFQLPKSLHSHSCVWPRLVPGKVPLYRLRDAGDYSLYFEFRDTDGKWRPTENDPRHFRSEYLA